MRAEKWRKLACSHYILNIPCKPVHEATLAPLPLLIVG